MSYMRTDPETGKKYMFAGLITPGGTLDDRRADRDAFDKLLERRAPELTHNRRRLTLRQTDRIEWLLGWRASDETGTVICPDCGSEQLPDSTFCGHCGNALIPVEGEQPTQPNETVKCPSCGHYNAPANAYCVSCGEPIPLSQASASSRPRRALRPERAAPAVFTRPAAHAHDDVRGGQMVVARETFDAIDPRTHQTVHVKAGRTKIRHGCWLYQLRPSAFQYAA
jgi:hypothetical protein